MRKSLPKDPPKRLPRGALLLALAAPFLGGGVCSSGPDFPPDTPPRCRPTFAPLPDDGGAAPGVLVELGTPPDGASRPFRAVGEGQPVRLIPGPQGGSMIGVSLRITRGGAPPAERCAIVHLDVLPESRGPDLAAPPDAGPPVVAYVDGAYTLNADGTTAAFLVRVDGLAAPLSLDEVDLRVRATVTAAGARGEASARVRPIH